MGDEELASYQHFSFSSMILVEALILIKINACVCACVHACARVCACVRACVCACVRACV